MQKPESNYHCEMNSQSCLCPAEALLRRWDEWVVGKTQWSCTRAEPVFEALTMSATGVFMEAAVAMQLVL